jgi:hypothetical protein
MFLLLKWTSSIVLRSEKELQKPHTQCLEVFIEIKLCLDHMSVWLKKKFGVGHKDLVNDKSVG